MKTYKELISQLNEGEEQPGNYSYGVGSGQRSAHSDMGNYRVELGEIVTRLNAFTHPGEKLHLSFCKQVFST